MALVELARFYTSFEAAIVRSRLESEGIDCFTFDSEMNWGGLDGVVPVRLMVDEDDFASARRLMKEAGDRP
jgi:hypothetical protein